jgi:hypothetical protein
MKVKNIITTTFLLLWLFSAYSQPVYDYKIKTATNAAERTKLLDIYRASLFNQLKQEMVFVVKHFKVSGNYAWLMAELQRKDGKEIRVPESYYAFDCCHAEALFKKSGSKWLIAEENTFSTDIWWFGISKRHPQAPKGIFDEIALKSND